MYKPVHYRLRFIKQGQFRFSNFASHFKQKSYFHFLIRYFLLEFPQYKLEKIEKIFFRLYFHHEGVEYQKNYFERFFSGSSVLSSCKISGLIFDPFTFSLKNDIFLYNICRKIFFYLRFYTSTKNFIKIRPKMSKRQPIKKKTFFTYYPS